MIQRVKTPIIYPGGKSLLLPHLRSVVPPHETCIDLFGGGAAFILDDTFTLMGVYNDINSDACNFFRVLRDSVLSQQLYSALYVTPYSREEYYSCYDNYRQCDDPVERARQWFVAVNLGFTHEVTNRSFRVAKSTDIAGALKNHVDDIPKIIEKLRNIVIENLDWKRCLEIYDVTDNTLIFADPPYISSNKDTLRYEVEFGIKEHLELLEYLSQTKSDVILCGYDSELYFMNLDPKKWSLVKKVRQAQVRNSSASKDVRTEHIWVKKKERGSLFDDTICF